MYIIKNLSKRLILKSTKILILFVAIMHLTTIHFYSVDTRVFWPFISDKEKKQKRQIYDLTFENKYPGEPTSLLKVHAGFPPMILPLLIFGLTSDLLSHCFLSRQPP
jgi:hypothetical protein